MTTGELFLGGITLLIAVIAVAAIVANFVIQKKAIAENRRIREEDREVYFKIQALDEISECAKEFSQILVLSGRKSDMEKMQLLGRLGALIVNGIYMLPLTIAFDIELGNKIKEVNDQINEFRERVPNSPSGVNKPLLAITEKNKSFTTRAFDSINHLIAFVSMTKIELLIKRQ